MLLDPLLHLWEGNCHLLQVMLFLDLLILDHHHLEDKSHHLLGDKFHLLLEDKYHPLQEDRFLLLLEVKFPHLLVEIGPID